MSPKPAKWLVAQLAGPSAPGIAIALAVGLLLAHSFSLLLVEGFLVDKVDPGFTFQLPDRTANLKSTSNGVNDVNLAVRSAEGGRVTRIIVSQNTASRAGEVVAQPGLVLEARDTGDDQSGRSLRLCVTAFDCDGVAHPVDWYRLPPVNAPTDVLARLSPPGLTGFRHVSQDVSVARLRKLVQDGFADRVRAATGSGKPLLAVGDLERLVLPEIDALIVEGTRDVGRANAAVAAIELLSHPLDILILAFIPAIVLLLLARLVAHYCGIQKVHTEHTLTIDELLRLPPGLGLLGTVIGMIGAVASSEEDVTRRAIASAMGSTFLGAVGFAPLVVMNLMVRAATREPTTAPAPKTEPSDTSNADAQIVSNPAFDPVADEGDVASESVIGSAKLLPEPLSTGYHVTRTPSPNYDDVTASCNAGDGGLANVAIGIVVSLDPASRRPQAQVVDAAPEPSSRHPSPRGAALRVLKALKKLVGRSRTGARLSHTQIADESRVSVTTVRRSLATLEHSEHVVIRRDGQRPHAYRVRHHSSANGRNIN